MAGEALYSIQGVGQNEPSPRNVQVNGELCILGYLQTAETAIIEHEYEYTDLSVGTFSTAVWLAEEIEVASIVVGSNCMVDCSAGSLFALR